MIALPRPDSTAVAWAIVVLVLFAVLVVGAEGRSRQLEALRRRDVSRG